MRNKNTYIIAGPNGSGKTTFIDFLRELKKKGYRLHLFFLWIPSPELALARIKDRVAEGGHDVPVEDVRRRFDRGIQNFFRFYKPLLNSWMFFYNAGPVPQLIAEEKDGKFLIVDKDLYQMIPRRIL